MSTSASRTPAERQARVRPLTVVLVCVLVSLATRWLSLVVDVIDLDETCHIIGAQVVLAGGRLYTDFVDNKPPLLYAYYALAQLLAGRSLFAVHLVTAAVVVPLTGFAVSRFYEHSRIGIVAALLFLVSSVAFIGHDMLASNAELLMILPGAWALVLLRDVRGPGSTRRNLGAGVLFGLAVLCKPQLATWAAACAAVGIWSRGREGSWARGLMDAAALASGLAVPLLAAYAYFAAIGGAGAFLYWAAWHNLAYANNPVALREGLQRFSTYFVAFVLVTGPLWWAAAHHPRTIPSVYRRVLLMAVLAASLPPAFIGFRFYPHYFIQLYVPLALAAAPWVDGQLSRGARGGRVVVASTLVLAVLFSVANAVLYLAPVGGVSERDPVFKQIAARLRADPCGRGPLFVWGWAPMIYYYAGYPVASRFVVLPQAQLTGYVFGNLASNRGELPEGPVVAEHWDWLMDDLARLRPTYIVDTAPANIYRWGRYPIARYPRLRRYVQREFEPAETIRGVVIYRRRGCDAGGNRDGISNAPRSP